MKVLSKKTLKTVFSLDRLVLFIYFFLLFSNKIQLLTADIGRHIKNGEYFFKDLSVLYTNFYSYTQPDFSFINHHWFYGVYSYLAYTLGGFVVVGVLNSVVYALAVVLSYVSLSKYKGKVFALLVVFLLAPLFARRTEVRPETISFLFISLYLFLLQKYREGSLNTKKLYLILLFTQLTWVNTHIFFILGIGVVGFLLIDFIVNKNPNLKSLALLILLMCVISLVNPFFIKGFLAPLNIFKEYGYMIIENQSLFFMHKRFGGYIYLYSFALMGLVLVLFALNLMNFKKDLYYYLLIVFSIVLALKFNRALPIFSLFLIYSLNISVISKSISTKLKPIIPALSVVVFSLVLIPTVFSPLHKNGVGFGLVPNSMGSSVFLKSTSVRGPFFNNYDIGGFFIFNLFDEHKVFVDNRPEAYSVDFLQNTYIKMQEDEAYWDEMSRQYNINAIYFYRHDLTPWAQPFLIRRVEDKSWIPVYVDTYTIILLKDNDVNKEVIDMYKLPNDMFRSVKN